MTAAVVESFNATPVQVRLMETMSDGQSRIIGFGGGIRGTKTFGSLATLITLCRVYPGSRWAVIRKDLQRLKDTTVPSFNKLRELAGGFVGPIMDSQTLAFASTCRNGSVILFRGENIDKDPELLRFHGYEVNGFLNEEADELSERTLVKEMERAGTWIIPNRPIQDQPSAYILNTFNPCAGWPRRRFYLPWRDRTIKPPYAFIPTTAADNPFISDAQREAWKEMPDAEYRRFVLGDWDSLTGAYYDTLTPEVLIDASDVDVQPHWRFWGSYDWGYGHWAVFCGWVTDEDGTDYLLQSVWLRKVQDADQIAEIVRDIDPRCFGLVYAGHDCWSEHRAHGARGEPTAEVFAAGGILLVRADIDRVNGGRAVNRQLKAKRVRIVRTPSNVKGYDQLSEILPDPLDIRKPLKVDAEDGIGGDDFADAFRYGVATHGRPATAPAAREGKQQDRALSVTLKGGRVVRRKTPQEELDAEIQRESGAGHMIESLPRW